MLFPINLERFPVCTLGCKRPTVKRCIVSAYIQTVFTEKAMVPQSFPTSLLPWFLNYDWQGGSVFPSAHPPLEHCGVKSTKAAKRRKLGVPSFKISAWIVKREVTQLKAHGLAASFLNSDVDKLYLVMDSWLCYLVEKIWGIFTFCVDKFQMNANRGIQNIRSVL